MKKIKDMTPEELTAKRRAVSIRKLKTAIKNGTMGASNPNTKYCVYYCNHTKTRCAIGILLSKKVLEKNRSENGNVYRIKVNERSYAVIGRLISEGFDMSKTGLTEGELISLQRNHDDVVQALYTQERVEKLEELKRFINSL